MYNINLFSLARLVDLNKITGQKVRKSCGFLDVTKALFKIILSMIACKISLHKS